MWRNYTVASTLSEVLDLLAEHRGKARIAAGTTDIMLELERGIRPGVDYLIDISRVPGLDLITLDEAGLIHIGPMVTHNDCVNSRLIREFAFPLAQACWHVGSPQIRNRGTIAGNLVTASPANDTIPPLVALNASVRLKSSNGERVVPLDLFYSGVRKTVLEPDEILVDIFFTKMQPQQRGIFYKFALRRAQAISVVNTAIILNLDRGQAPALIRSAVITLGSVAPTIIRAEDAEQYLIGKNLDASTLEEAANKAVIAAKPISDLRSSDRYRQRIIKVIVQRALTAIAGQKEKEGFPADPVLLNGENIPGHASVRWQTGDPIVTTINGKTRQFFTGENKSLLRLLREEGLFTGVKEGCAEGECGACTVFLDGAAVMACLVPAPRAHGSEIITIEGIEDNALHPVQSAFIQEGAVQCGYCTPGFIMSAVKLLEEKPRPTRDQIKDALTGNLCRCTGYYKIISAIELAATTRSDNEQI